MYFGIYHATGEKALVQQAIIAASDLYKEMAKTPAQLEEINSQFSLWWILETDISNVGGTRFVLRRFKQSSKAAESALLEVDVSNISSDLATLIDEIKKEKKSGSLTSSRIE